ncbi:hypothetical protein DXG01_000973, partial [Tephrocybe rancida]
PQYQPPPGPPLQAYYAPPPGGPPQPSYYPQPPHPGYSAPPMQPQPPSRHPSPYPVRSMWYLGTEIPDIHVPPTENLVPGFNPEEAVEKVRSATKGLGTVDGMGKVA